MSVMDVGGDWRRWKEMEMVVVMAVVLARDGHHWDGRQRGVAIVVAGWEKGERGIVGERGN